MSFVLSEKLESVTRREDSIYLFVYDICRSSSLKHLQKEITSIGFEEATQSTYDSEANLPNVFIVGNKVDLEYWRQVRAELDNRTKSELGESTLAAKFIEISTFSGANVDKLAAGLLKRVFMDIVPFNQRGNLQAVARPLADSTIRTELLRTILKSCEMDKQSMKMNFSNKNSECVRYSATRIQRWTGEIDRPMSPSCPRGIELMELVSGGLEHARVGLRYLKDIYRTAFYDPPLLELRKSIKVLKDSIDLFSHSLHALQGVLSASSSYSSPPPVSPPPVSPPLVSPPSVSPPPVSPPPVSPPPSLGIVRRDDAIAGTEEMKSPSSDSFEMVLASIRDLNRFSTTTATNAATTSVAAATTSTTHPTTLGLGFTGGANVEGIDVHSLLNFVEGVVTQLASITEECSQFASLLPPSPSIRSMHQVSQHTDHQTKNISLKIECFGPKNVNFSLLFYLILNLIHFNSCQFNSFISVNSTFSGTECFLRGGGST